MKKAILSIDEQGKVILSTNCRIWMTEYEIASLFDVFWSAVIANRKAIFKSGVLRKEDVCKEVRTAKGYMELYNLEMITALAFRIRSRNTEVYRQWLMGKATKADTSSTSGIFFQNAMLN